MKPPILTSHAAASGGALLLIAAVLFVLLASLNPLQLVVPASDSPTIPHILIDPGHGGADGGAKAADGSLEKEYNLSISLTLRDNLSERLRIFFISTMSTRTPKSSSWKKTTVRRKTS